MLLEMKLHLGCGSKFLEGYIHVDVKKYSHVDYVSSIDKLYFLDDESVEEIYACHVLEHVGRNEYKNVLKEWRRVLKIGGILRIAVPDFEAAVEWYSVHKNIKEVTGLTSGGQRDQWDYHKVIFDFDLLRYDLIELGFDDINRYDWRDFLPEGFDDYSRSYLPHMDFDNGKLMSLNITAVKR